MLSINVMNLVFILVLSILLIVCSIGIIIAIIFQNKKDKKYKEFLNIIKEKENPTLEIKTVLTKEEINSIDSSLDVDKLMSELYEKYLSFQNKINICDVDFDNMLTGSVKEFYIDKIKALKSKKFYDITDNIDLIGYSIIEFTKTKLKFRININCFSYKKSNESIISGSNNEKLEKILIITYEKVNGIWLISNYENVYEKKLSN